MNWEIFSPLGYASIALWLCMPILWLIHFLSKRKKWLVHLALLFGLAALITARVHSSNHVQRIRVDRSQQIQEQLDRQAEARQAATAAREAEVAQIRFAEDGRDDFLDQAGMDEADLKYMQSFSGDPTPQWKKQKKKRSTDETDNSLEAQIGASETAEGISSADSLSGEASPEPILMSDQDKRAADRLDSANLTLIRWMLALGLLLIVVDYLKRANQSDQAYFPLPLPSSWADAMSPREPIIVYSKASRRKLVDEMRFVSRRGESFLLVTENPETAGNTAADCSRLPLGFLPVEVLNLADFPNSVNDDFVFETLWYGRNSFVLNSVTRAEQMLARFIEMLEDRRSTRARVRQTVNVVWDIKTPLPEETRIHFAKLGQATGFTLWIHHENP